MRIYLDDDARLTLDTENHTLPSILFNKKYNNLKKEWWKTTTVKNYHTATAKSIQLHRFRFYFPFI